ncbi:histidine kinase, partial [Streptomyces sp. TRM76130]|nr:histidine kinase [Streptomyces sp. TRM76130]
MRARLLPLLIVLMAAVLLAFGVPLAVSVAGAEQQKTVVDRIDDTARFASLAQFVGDAPSGSRTTPTQRLETLQSELISYYEVYGIRAAVYYT